METWVTGRGRVGEEHEQLHRVTDRPREMEIARQIVEFVAVLVTVDPFFPLLLLRLKAETKMIM